MGLLRRALLRKQDVLELFCRQSCLSGLEERTFFLISLAYLVHDFFRSSIIIAFAFDHCIQAQWWRRAKKSQIGLETQILGGAENCRQLVDSVAV
jgi:hypothetical protein